MKLHAAALALILLTALTALLPLQAARADGPDISGYKTPDNSWQLYAERDNIDTDGFKKLEGPYEGAHAYYDHSRTIQFSGEDTQARIYLIFADSELVGVCFDISNDERSYKSLRAYYKERYGKLKAYANSETKIQWMDEDGDTLTVQKTHRADDTACTFVMYLSDPLWSKMSGDDVPAWMKSSLKDL